MNITLDITPAQAMALAQYLKRAGFTDYRLRAVSDDEAYDMLEAAEKLREELARNGYAPR